MSTNPMQKKVINAFLAGMLIMLVVAILLGGLCFFLVIKPNNLKNTEYIQVYQLKRNVKSGEEITSEMMQLIEVPTIGVPNNVIKLSTGIEEKKLARIDLERGTILTSNMLVENENELQSSLRNVEYNMITLPVELVAGDYVDIRITFANGQDLIVLAKKKIKKIYGDTIAISLTEEEILMMNSAIVEAYIMPTSNLYITRYAQAGTQVAATPTYLPTDEVSMLIQSNANITKEALNDFNNRWNNKTRQYINNEIAPYNDSKRNNIQAGLQTQIDVAKRARENYLAELDEY